jgi:hypothetical protein
VLSHMDRRQLGKAGGDGIEFLKLSALGTDHRQVVGHVSEDVFCVIEVYHSAPNARSKS